MFGFIKGAYTGFFFSLFSLFFFLLIRSVPFLVVTICVNDIQGFCALPFFFSFLFLHIVYGFIHGCPNERRHGIPMVNDIPNCARFDVV